MEAKSLSDIIQLAANPPKYPRNPTEIQRDDLILYIARVPGSRDIILTTLKPQLKNVTAEDVAASLYYFHLNTDDDERLLEDVTTEEAGTITQKPLIRKPLPEPARSSLDIGRESALATTTLHSDSIPLKRKPITSASSASQDQSVLRRPLGPRPPMDDYSLAKRPLPGIENNLPNFTGETQPYAQHPHNSGHTAQLSESTKVMSRSISDTASFSITIIRRDPTTGSQWNIGSIIGKPALGDTQGGQESPERHTKKHYFDISVHLTTPGYTCFRESQMSGGITPQNPSILQEHMQFSSNNSFNRDICMEGTSFWGRSSTQHNRTRSDITDNRARGRSSSGLPTIGPAEASSQRFEEQNETATSPQSKGYMFYSPWGGRCKFATGSGGRSLKCKHSLPASPYPYRTGENSNLALESVMVSELRFNLPSSTVFSNEAGTKRSIFPKLSHVREKLSSSKGQQLLPPQPLATSYSTMHPSHEDVPSLFSTQDSRPSTINAATESTDSLRNRNRDTVKITEDTARLDLSIGREKAGGGNRGKRAKLGKLIIHNEGFKMLDLIVGANMGIWWSIGDRMISRV